MLINPGPAPSDVFLYFLLDYLEIILNNPSYGSYLTALQKFWLHGNITASSAYPACLKPC